MRTNGTLSFEVISEEHFDEFGEIVTTEAQWSEPIDCLIKTNSDTRRGAYEDGEFRQASFTILVELSETPFSAATRLRLTRLGEELGDYRVLSLEPQTTVGRMQIIV